jgi:hypothetical protein
MFTTARQILSFNAAATAISAMAMLAARSFLGPLFGLSSPLLLDIVAVGFLIYAAVLAGAARRSPVPRRSLLAFAAADAAWVVISAAGLLLFWAQLTLIARVLVLAVALFCEVAATLQFRAAGRRRAGTAMSASEA